MKVKHILVEKVQTPIIRLTLTTVTLLFPYLYYKLLTYAPAILLDTTRMYRNGILAVVMVIMLLIVIWQDYVPEYYNHIEHQT